MDSIVRSFGSASTAGMRRGASLPTLLYQLMSTPSKFRHPIFAPYMQDLTQNLRRGFCQSSYRALAEVYYGFRSLNTRPSEQFGKILLDIACQGMEHSTAHDITSVMSSLARLGIEPPDLFLEQIQKRVPEIIETFSQRDACKFVYALAILDAVAEHYRGHDRVHANEIYTDVIANKKFLDYLYTAERIDHRGMVSRASLWFSHRALMPIPLEKNRRSNSEYGLKKIFRAVGATIVPSLYIPKLDHVVDVSARFREAQIHAEFDGPTHFVKSFDGQELFLNGPTIFQTALEARHTSKLCMILRVPFNVCDAHKQEDKPFWHGVCHQVEQKGKGSHLLLPNGNLCVIGNRTKRPENTLPSSLCIAANIGATRFGRNYYA